MHSITIKYKIIIIVALLSTNLIFITDQAYLTDINFDVNKIEISIISDNISFSKPYEHSWADYIYLDVDEADYFLRDYEKPMLPVYKKVYTFPLGTVIDNVNCTTSIIHNLTITDTIKPASNVWCIPAINGTPFGENYDYRSKYEIIIENESIYSSSILYPDSWYDYTLKIGLEGNENVLFLILDIYPVRYSPSNNIIRYVDDINVKIAFHKPIGNMVNSNQVKYDMIIITPSKFSKPLAPLVKHKNNIGISTIIKTTEEIFDEYDGRDPPEQIKKFIYDAKETWDINYVLLVGGLKSYIYANARETPQYGSKYWYIPVRYTSLEEGTIIQGSISDLYYSDIYKYNVSYGYNFEDWDSNGNKIFAEGDYKKVEEIDLCPDVHLGRLPCRNIAEVKIVVDKIINYESNYYKDDPWFQKMISISGNSGIITGGKPDMEVYCEKAIEYMDNLVEPIKIYSSNKDKKGLVPTPVIISKEISKGAGFVHFMGHGNTLSWNILWPDCEYSLDNMTGGFNEYWLWNLFNGDKLPVAVVSGCATSLFNTTFITSILSSRFGKKDYYLTQGIPAFGCLCWRLIAKIDGGAIATIGTTATENMNQSFLYNPIGFSFNSELDYNFFYQIGMKNAETFGSAYSGAITKSIKENSIGSYEMHCIMQWQPFGDPSLSIGGRI